MHSDSDSARPEKRLSLQEHQQRFFVLSGVIIVFELFDVKIV